MAFKLSRIPGTTGFKGQKGASVALDTRNVLHGRAKIARADYDGKALAVSDKGVTLTIVEGQAILNLVFDCIPDVPDTVVRGELQEIDGVNGQFMRDIFSHSPAQAMLIAGSKP
jgi:hypothetical protein